MCCDCAAQVFLGLCVWGLFDLPGEIEVIPADDGVLDKPVAGLGDLLFLLFGQGEPTGIADSDGTGEPVGQFDLVELALDGLPQGEVIDIAQDEQRFDDLPEGLVSALIELVVQFTGSLEKPL